MQINYRQNAHVLQVYSLWQLTRQAQAWLKLYKGLTGKHLANTPFTPFPTQQHLISLSSLLMCLQVEWKSFL